MYADVIRCLELPMLSAFAVRPVTSEVPGMTQVAMTTEVAGSIGQANKDLIDELKRAERVFGFTFQRTRWLQDVATSKSATIAVHEIECQAHCRAIVYKAAKSARVLSRHVGGRSKKPRVKPTGCGTCLAMFRIFQIDHISMAVFPRVDLVNANRIWALGMRRIQQESGKPRSD
eukprot:m.562674 g.562674  ORF g.562674 m.562674 type:complete len:174 (-) comp57808_c0_seq4:2001-2522(-)